MTPLFHLGGQGKKRERKLERKTFTCREKQELKSRIRSVVTLITALVFC